MAARARASRTASSSIDGQLARRAPVAVTHPLVRRAARAGDLALEPKQAWTHVAEFAAPGVDAVNFGPGDPAFAHRRDEQIDDRRPRALLRAPGGASAADLRVNSAVLDAQGTYPFVRLTRGEAAAAARGIEVIDFGVGDPREPTAGVHPRGARRRLLRGAGCAIPLAVGPARAARGDRGVGAAGASASQLDPDDEVDPDARLQGGDLLARAGRSSQPRGGEDIVAVTEPGYPVHERGALFAGAAVVELPLHDERRLPPRPRRGRRWDRRSRSSGSTTRTTRPARVAPLALLRATRPRARRASTASCSPPTRRTASSGSSEPPASALQLADRTNVARLQHALEALAR